MPPRPFGRPPGLTLSPWPCGVRVAASAFLLSGLFLIIYLTLYAANAKSANAKACGGLAAINQAPGRRVGQQRGRHFRCRGPFVKASAD